MHWIDWVLVAIPVLIVVVSALKTQRYVKGVSDFLAAGRVAGRYVLTVASGEAGMGLISVIAAMELHYSCGFAISFWSSLIAPISLIMGLVGFCTYRFRETKSMTMGQFFEIRYAKSFRVTAAVIQSISGIVNYAIFPAVGGRFLIYFLDLPLNVNILGLNLSTFGLCMFLFLGLALVIALMGGQVTIMVTDCVQGILSYPMYVVIAIYLFYKFSWGGEMEPAMLARAPGESFLNPFDVSDLRDFNLFYVFAGIAGMFLGRMSWSGSQGYNCAAKSPHESKMGALLGTWRGGFGTMMFILLGVAAYTYMNHANYAPQAREVRAQLAAKTIEDVAAGGRLADKRTELLAQYKTIEPRKVFSPTFASSEEYKKEFADPFVDSTTAALSSTPEDKKVAQTFKAIYNQMTVPLAVRAMLPVGITGIFCALMLFLMISTDTTYMHSWGSIIVQDFIVPLKKKAFDPKTQIFALRCSITGVAAFAFFFSFYFAQIDFIYMFFAITGAIWSGAGAVITLGLYWRRGTTAGAYTSLITGAVIAISGIIAQKMWVGHIYPVIAQAGLVESLDAFLKQISGPFNPYIVWEMNPLKFPLTSIEVAFIANITTVLLYVAVSLLTCKELFNMDRMLHRGIYQEKGAIALGHDKFTIKSFFLRRVLGIDEQYTRNDKILAWSVFIWSFGYGFLLCFVTAAVWCAFDPWAAQWWSKYFFIKNMVVATIVGVVSTFWFGIYSTRDLFRLFHDLDKREANVLDDGRVIGHVSAVDVAEIEADEREAGK